MLISLPPPPRKPEEYAGWAAKLTVALIRAFARVSTGAVVVPPASAGGGSSSVAIPTIIVDGQSRAAVVDVKVRATLEEILLLLRQIRDRLPSDPGR